MPGKLISIVLSPLPLLTRYKAAEVVVISDDDDDDNDGHDDNDGPDGSDQEIHLIANPVFSYSQQSISRPALPLSPAPGNRNGNGNGNSSTAIVIDSDSEDGIDGIETDDDDDDGKDQDILGLLSQMADDSMVATATATATARTRTRIRTIGSTQSTSVLETCHGARTEITERGSTRRRPLGKSQRFAESILTQASLLFRARGGGLVVLYVYGLSADI